MVSLFIILLSGSIVRACLGGNFEKHEPKRFAFVSEDLLSQKATNSKERLSVSVVSSTRRIQARLASRDLSAEQHDTTLESI